MSTRIHIHRTEARTYCGQDARVLPEGSRAVSEAKYRGAADRFAGGVVLGACGECVAAMTGAQEDARKALAAAKRALKKRAGGP